MQRNTYRFLWMICALAAFGLACNLFSGIGESVTEARSTGQAMATSVQDGRDALATGQAMITQVVGSSAVQTAQAFATQEGSKILATAQAFATAEGPSIQATLQAVVTKAPGIEQTLVAMATSDGPGMIQTAQALGTQIAPPNANVSPAIPLWSGANDDLIATESMVSYTTPASFPELRDFYQREMPPRGWTAVETGTFITEQSAVLNYDRPEQRAIVTLNWDASNKRTIVLITLQSK